MEARRVDTPTSESRWSRLSQKIFSPLGGSLCSIMPKWQISTYVSGNPSNWCHFIQIFATPPRTTNCITASPHAQAGFAIFSASQLEWSFLLCCSLPKPRAWLPGCRDHQAGWPGLRGSNQREEEILMSYSPSAWRFTSPRATRWWGRRRSELTVMMASFCSAIVCGAVKQSGLLTPGPRGLDGLNWPVEKKSTWANTYKPEHCVLTYGCRCTSYGAYLNLCRNGHNIIEFMKLTC